MLRQPLQRPVHELALHARRESTGLLVDRDDPAGVDCFLSFVGGIGVGGIREPAPDDFVLRIGHLQAAAVQLDRTEQHDLLVRLKDVAKEGLVEPDDADRSAAIANERLENLEPRPPRRADAAAENLARNRRDGSRFQAGDRLKMRAVLVAERKTIEKIFDGLEAGAPQIGRAPRPDAFQILERRGKELGQSPYCCTITARPSASSISRMRFGSANGASTLMPRGYSGERE